MIRAFVALPVPPGVAAVLEAAQAGLPCGRAVPAENFHLTLVFLGEVPGPVLDDVHAALERVRAPAFDLALSGLGVFGGTKPRALYARAIPLPALSHLQTKVARAVREAGLDLPARKFQPHVTLARFNATERRDDLLELQAFIGTRSALSVGPFPVDDFALFRSHLGRHGPAYEDLAAYPLDAVS